MQPSLSGGPDPGPDPREQTHPGRARSGRHRSRRRRGRNGRTQRWLPLVLVAVALAWLGVSQISNSAGSRRSPLPGLGEITVIVVDSAGEQRRLCMLLAESPDQQQRGLKGVSDPRLGGYDGIAFVNSTDVDYAFDTYNTPLRLITVFLGVDGNIVSISTMESCDTQAGVCAEYTAGRLYRSAIQMPVSRFTALGVTDDTVITLDRPQCG